ncbi:hypothetical protein ERJ75_000933600 [Trypanosoma vivax]|nr:hypothetical protein TRVL_00669 [Trypanosoma vivax]KAH8611647.1 hypothetical protein ERJ75_000933600 [Trypanosoma vivax]
MATEDNGTILASSLSSDVLRSALDSVMDNAFGFPLVRASPRSLIEELLQLPSGTPSHVLLSKGEYGSCCIKNTAPCIITAEAGPFNDTKSEVGWDAESQCGLKDLSALSVFNDLVAIEAHGPIAFKGIWFSNPVHITGVGPVFFSQCLFGAAVKVVPDDAAPTALFAHIHISINDVCTFTECQFNHKCVAATVENSNEAPVLTATGDTKLNVHHCGFFGPGVTSPAIMLCERAKLEADNLVISRWSGNSLVVGDHSRAFVWNSHFSLNGGGVWVKGHGKLEIRATHLKTVRGRGSNLVLTDKGCCTAYECIISSPVSKRLTRGKSLVLARDKTYLSLFTCELAWLARDPSSDVVDVASLKEFVSSCQSDRVDEFGLFLVMLMENSKGTLSQCSLRLPLLWSHDEWRVAVGVLLKSVPQADAIPLYAVQNAIFFSFAVNDDAAPGEAGSNSTSDLYTLGLVLPADSDSSDVRGIEALGAMWMETNRFIRVDGSPMVDLSQLFVTYEMYCGFTNQILKTYSSEGIDDFPFFHNPPTMRKETLLYKQPSASDSCSSTSVLAAEGAGDRGNCTGSPHGSDKNDAFGNLLLTRDAVDDGNDTSSTSLTSYGEEDRGQLGGEHEDINGSSPEHVQPKTLGESTRGSVKPGCLSVPDVGSSTKGCGRTVDAGNVPSEELIGASANSPSTPSNAVVPQTRFSRKKRKQGSQGINAKPNSLVASIHPSGTRRQEKKKRPNLKQNGKSHNDAEHDAESTSSFKRKMCCKSNPNHEENLVSLTCVNGAMDHDSPLPCLRNFPHDDIFPHDVEDTPGVEASRVTSSPMEIKPWDVSGGRAAHATRFRHRRQDVYIKQYNSIEESFSDFDHRSNRNWTPKREDTGVFLDSLLGRSTLATPRSTKSHPSFSGTTNAILLGTQRLNLKSSVNVTIRLYDAFFRKCNMTQHFSDLLNELRDGQRQRERLTRDEMEKQAQRLHTQGLQSSFISSRVQVAGAARNYVLQKRNEQKHQPGGEASPETSLVRPDEEVKHIGNGEAEVRPTQPVKRMPDATNCNGDICDRTPSTSSKSHTPPSMVATTNKKTYRKKRKHVQEK